MQVMVTALVMLHVVTALPVTLEDLEIVSDSTSVGSYVREVRAAPPEDYHKTYENDGDGEIGYSRKKGGGGKKGYQHFDSYHKKAGDNYEFEKQDSYGLDDESKNAAHEHDDEKKAARYREPTSDDEDHESAEKPHHDHEEIKERSSDGNDGVEANGHDAADYVLPEKYTYGTGDEYNF